MVISKRKFFTIFNLIIALLLYCFNVLDEKGCAIYAVITIIILIYTMIKYDNRRLSYSSSLLLYTMGTQFGLIIPYILYGRNTVSNYSDYTLRFMQSSYLEKAILLGIIAVFAMRLGTEFARNRYGFSVIAEVDAQKNDISSKMYVVGIGTLVIVLFYFAFNVAIGEMKLFASYGQYRESSVVNSGIYSYILILFYVGTIYLASAGGIKKHKLGWIIWLLLVLIFVMNGNKGEFMYALLAVFAMKGVEGNKINLWMVVLVCIILFLMIPMITSLRGVGIIGNISSVKINFFDAFTEIGMQIRTSVYTLEDISSGKICYLYGDSYLQPIVNLITPFGEHAQATAFIKSMYIGQGYSQVIESYLNFKIIGVLIYFSMVGYLLGKHEAKLTNRFGLAYLGTITCIFINATRNYFAFVPGQIIIVTAIYIVAKKVHIFKK